MRVAWVGVCLCARVFFAMCEEYVLKFVDIARRNKSIMLYRFSPCFLIDHYRLFAAPNTVEPGTLTTATTKKQLSHLSDMIKGNESDVGNIDFELQAKIDN